MSQERTRFPIQPTQRFRTAKSSKDIRQATEGTPDRSERRTRARRDQDKPAVPPHRRHDEE